MKKKIFCILGCIMLLGVTGCKAQDNSKLEDNNVSQISKHTGTIKYKDEIKEIEVIDYQINYFNLSDLFSDFDSSAVHNIKCDGTLGTIRPTENAYSKGDNTNNLNGNILYIYAAGKDNIAQYEISDNFSIIITEFISASSINWEDYIKFKDTAVTSSISDISILTFSLEVNNISDEDLEGKITNVYLNNSSISKNYILDTEYSVRKKSKSDVNYPATRQALSSAGVKNIKKMGLEIELIDKQKNQVYKGTKWLNLD